MLGGWTTTCDYYADDLTAGAEGQPVGLDLSAYGYGMLAASVTMGSTWGNASIRADVSQLVANMRGGVWPDGKVHLFGVSMGGVTAYNWAIRNIEKVASICTVLPVIDMQSIYDRDPILFMKASISAAHGGRPPDSENPASSPRALGRVPNRIYYSTDDTVTPAAETTAFASAIGAELVSMGAVGHTFSSEFTGDLAAAYFDSIDGPSPRSQVGTSDALLRFIGSSLRPAILLPMDYRAIDTTGDFATGAYPGTITGDGVGGTVDGPLGVAQEFDGTGQVTTTYKPYVADAARSFFGVANRYDSDDRHTLVGGTSTLLVIETDGDVNFYPSSSVGPGASWASVWPGPERNVSWMLVHDDGANTSTLYIDGVSQGTVANSTAYHANAIGSNFRIGGYSGGLNFVGGQSYVGVVERALGPGDAMALHKASRA
jgi:pimeloyl-ACP methyl ester carboxylesterase